MTDNKKKEETKKPEIKLPQLNFGYLGTCFVHTDKGMYLWQAPVNTTWENSLSYLKYTMTQIEKIVEEAKKKAAEENKLPSENKKEKQEYKAV